LEKEIILQDGSLVFDIKGDAAALERVTGNITVLDIPEEIECAGSQTGYARVKSIFKKALLGKKTIKKITVPDCVESIGDWAFSGCSNLAEIRIPLCIVGESVLSGCRSLRIVDHPNLSEDKRKLFAGCIRWEAPSHLTDLDNAGRDWLEKFDAWVLSLLRSPDDDGFQNQILCGEEDYGSSDRDAYESKKRVMKASVCMERLLNPEELKDSSEKIFSDYIYSHRSGSELGSESWYALRDEYPDKVHFELLSRLGCIGDDNRDTMIRELGESSGELKSLLVKSSGIDASGRFFSSLTI